VDGFAASLGLQKQTVLGTRFFHRLYRNNRPSPTAVLHVYIEGDGLPWLLPDLVAPDPTPRNPLMLQLLGQDLGPAIYLGRPCYFGYAKTPPCSAWWWTDGRFAPEVVHSMAVVLSRIIAHLCMKPAPFRRHL
jgi:hypothetical protein